MWLIQRLRFAGPDDGIVMHERYASHDVLTRLHERTPNVIVWAVEDLDRALELHEMGVSGIIADDLDLLAKIRQHR